MPRLLAQHLCYRAATLRTQSKWEVFCISAQRVKTGKSIVKSHETVRELTDMARAGRTKNIRGSNCSAVELSTTGDLGTWLEPYLEILVKPIQVCVSQAVTKSNEAGLRITM